MVIHVITVDDHGPEALAAEVHKVLTHQKPLLATRAQAKRVRYNTIPSGDDARIRRVVLNVKMREEPYEDG